VIKLLEENGSTNIETVQTIFGELHKIHSMQKFREGYGEGGFVVIKSEKEKNIG